jgi:hypothetical protein
MCLKNIMPTNMGYLEFFQCIDKVCGKFVGGEGLCVGEVCVKLIIVPMDLVGI